MFKRFCRDESGATAIEYAMIASIVSIAAVVALRGIGSQLGMKFTAVGNGLT